MQRHPSLFAGLLLLGATNAQSLPGPKDPPTGGVASHNAILPLHSARKPAVKEFGRLPLSFEPNQGQADRGVRFLTHSLGSTLSLNASEAVFTLPSHPRSLVKSPTTHQALGKSSFRSLRMQLLGADSRAAALQQQPLIGRVNYFLGKDPSQWHANVPTFARVGFRGVYPGVDVVYYGNQQRLEYDFIVAPHADPRQIDLGFAGAQGVHINAAGDLIVRVEGRELTWRKPAVYQQDKAGKHSIAAHFRLKRLPNGQAGVSFALGRYDAARSLVIDPVLLYSSRLEGTIYPTASLAIDGAGNAYVTGSTQSNEAQGRAYVVKMNPTGTALLYATYLGPTDFSAPAIAIDSSGNAYITGSGTTAFPTTPGAYKTQQSSGDELFVTKLNPTGTALVYSTFVGKNSYNAGTRGSYNHGIGIAVDSSGSAYVTGSAGSGFPTTPGAFQAANKAPNSLNAFVTKLNPTGTDLTYSTYLGGSVDLGSPLGDAGRGIAVDSSGSAYIVGSTASTDFPTTPGAFQRVSKAQAGGYAAFVTKLNPTGTALTYSTVLGGSPSDIGYGIAIDSVGNAYAVGIGSTDYPTTPGAFQPKLTAGGDFVTKLDPAGATLIYSTFLGRGGGDSGASGVSVDSSGNAYITGTAINAFPTTIGAFQRMTTVGPQAFVTKLNPAGTVPLYSTFLGGDLNTSPTLDGDGGLSIAVDRSGNVYVCGYADTWQFPTTPGAVDIGSGATFVTKLSPIPIFPDFNNDGLTDLLIQNSTTGAIASWFMQGSSWVGGAYFSLSPLSGYALIGVGDFEGRGSMSLVFQSRTTNRIVLWTTGGTNNAAIYRSDFVNLTPPPGWKVVGIGDFNADGKSDLVLQNQTTNQIAVWYMNGAVYQGGALLSSTPGAGWQVVGAGDFNADGFTDLAFQNQSTGQIALWYMNGTTYVGGTILTTVPASGWKAVGIGDYNGDGSADLLFQNQTTNQGAIWYLKNGAYVDGASLSLYPPPGWKIVGPR